ncbi:MAG TPA: glycosyltransferase family 25 protein [Rhabdochlamydiaceae bacterium]|nr:glycosyltransferase family 25 protein [Rhabdochlamydiaceae bacterium]
MKIRYGLALVAILGAAYLFFFTPQAEKTQKTELLSLLKPLDIHPASTGIPGIDSIYCINLDVRKDKWEQMQKRCSDQGLQVHRMPAINGWEELTRQQVKEIQKPYKASLNKGRAGCLLSHLSVLKDAEKRNFNCIMVLEDDVSFLGEMKQVSAYLKKLSSVDPEWDILFLDHWTLAKHLDNRPPENRPSSKMSEIIKKPQELIKGAPFQRTYYRHGAYAMIVSKKGVQKINSHFAENPVFFAYDLEYNHITNIKMYETDKEFVSVDLQISDTSTKPKL